MRPSVLVTGATGFVGRAMVRILGNEGFAVRAGIHTAHRRTSSGWPAAVEEVPLDLRDRPSLLAAMKGVETVYHFAALVDSSASRTHLVRINVEGSRNVWECAAEAGARRALYCSSTAVYGLLTPSNGMIAEDVRPRAIEPYGHSKLMGEQAALAVGATTGLHTTVIRPVAIFGSGEHTPFGKSFRDAVASKLLVAGGFRNRRFSFVQVDDVAGAALHLMRSAIPSGEIFNVAVNEPVTYEDAFESYLRVLSRAGKSFAKIRTLALLSALLHKLPSPAADLAARLGERFMFRIWHPGFDRNYSSRKLLGTGFRFRWSNFEDVLSSCVEPTPPGSRSAPETGP